MKNYLALELWLPDIKKYVFENAGQCLEAAGFSFLKPDNSYKQTHGKNNEEIRFVFTNQFPVSYRIGFLFQIWNHQIKTVKAGFPFMAKMENYKLRSLVLFMNNFVLPDQEGNEQSVLNALLLVTNKDLFVATDHITRLLQEQVIPLADQLFDLDGIDAYFVDRPGWSIDSLNFNNISTELTAAKLNKKRNFEEVYMQIVTAIDQKIQAKEMGDEMKEHTAKYCEYLRSKY